jgi:stage II sporulation protein P
VETDAEFVDVNNYSGKTADVKALLQKPLSWQLQQAEPTVLILHSHGTESYRKTEDYKETAKYRTGNTDYNVVSVGARLAQVLEAGGVKVIHDTCMHDELSYNNSYSHARTSTKEYLEKYPSVFLVLDIHRDAVENKQGEQVKFTVNTEKGTAAQLMLVVGTNARLSHGDWPENMALAVKLHALLEKSYPGICRPISFRAQRFNQDLSPGALIVEVGAAGNDRQEALLSAEILGQTILSMAQGTVTADSTR